MANNYNPRSDSSDSPQRRRRVQSSSQNRQPSSQPARQSSSQQSRQQSRSQSRSQSRTPSGQSNIDLPDVVGQVRRARRPSTSIVSGANTRRPAGEQADSSTQRRRREQDATTVGAARRRQTKDTRQKAAGSLFSKLIVVIVIVAVLLIAAIIVYFSPAFSVTQVRVDGAWHLTGARITNEAAIQSDSTLLRLDTDGISARLKADPWIAEVAIERQFPDTVVLNITERSALARVEIAPQSATAKATQWLVSSDSVWLGLIDSLSAAGIAYESADLKVLPLVRDVLATVEPVDGAKAWDEGVSNAVALLDGFTPQMRAQVATISAPDKAKTTLGLTNGVGVAIGAAEDVSIKEAAIFTLLEQYAGKLTYINVRVADKPSFRSTGSDASAKN
jgi:cell division protein FtsQ